MSANEFMQHAIALAERARDENEVPVGAVVVLNDDIIGRGYNRPRGLCDPSAHAEVLAIRDAAKRIGNYRLTDAALFVTKEPCVMCAGAILHARLARLVFGVRDEQFGAAGGAVNLLAAPFHPHQCHITAGVEAARCGALLSDFFAARRDGGG